MTPHPPPAADAAASPTPSSAPRAAPSTLTKVLRFLVVGGLSAGVDIGLLIALRELAGLSVALATTIAFWTALLVNFGLNRAWSFATIGGTPSAVGAPFLRYMVLVVVNYVATLVIVTGGASLGMPYALAKVIAVGLGALWTYVAYDRWVFA